MFDVDFSSRRLLFTFPFFSDIYINDQQRVNSKSMRTTDGFYASDERLSSSSSPFIELLNTSNRTNWHLKKKTEKKRKIYVKKYRPLYDDLSHDDYVKQEEEEEIFNNDNC